MALNTIKAGHWCGDCYRGNITNFLTHLKIGLKHCQDFAGVIGWICLSTEYKNCMSHMNWLCDKGHSVTKTWNDLQQGKRCGICAKNCKLTLQDCQEFARSIGWTCLSTEYKNTRTKMSWICATGHKIEMTLSNLKTGFRCLTCSGLTKKTIEDCHALATKNNWICKSKNIANSRSEVEWICARGHSFISSYNVAASGSGCPMCTNRHSRPELEIYNFIKNIYSETQSGVRKLLPTRSFELDIWLPSLRVGIEFDGTWHHNPMNPHYVPDRDLRKNRECEEADILLVRVKEEDYLKNKTEILNYLKDLLKYANIAYI